MLRTLPNLSASTPKTRALLHRRGVGIAYKEVRPMCRSIERLFNIDPCVTEDEIHAAALQFVRKISGVTKPSKANEAAFLAAVEGIAYASSRLLGSLQTSAPPLRRVDRAAKARERAAQRFPARRVNNEV